MSKSILHFFTQLEQKVTSDKQLLSYEFIIINTIFFLSRSTNCKVSL